MGTMRCKIVNGALLECPLYNEHHRARNWAAVIDIDGTAPGGLSRRFLPYGRGPVFYVVEQVALFDVIEFAGDNVSYSGTKRPNRAYGVVVAKTEDFLDFELFEDAAPAILAAREKRASKADVRKALETEKAHLEARAAAVASEMAALDKEDA